MGKLKTRVEALSHADRRKLVKVLWANTKAEAAELGKAHPGATVVRWMDADEYAAHLAAQGLPVPIREGVLDDDDEQ